MLTFWKDLNHILDAKYPEFFATPIWQSVLCECFLVLYYFWQVFTRLSHLCGCFSGIQLLLTCRKYLFILFIWGFTSLSTLGSWEGRGNQYIQLVKVLYCKLPTNGKQLPAFPLEVGPVQEILMGYFNLIITWVKKDINRCLGLGYHWNSHHKFWLKMVHNHLIWL